MEELLDTIWLKLEVLIHYFRTFLDVIFSPLNHLGPALAVFTIALVTVAGAKFFTKRFKTKRLRNLEEEFSHWHGVREEALKAGSQDGEKGRLLAKNIDQAKLNQTYYDMFIEGLLNSILTTYIPILIILGYVNEAYNAKNLLKLFGRDYIFRFASSGGKPVTIGATSWFVASVLMIYAGWYVMGKISSKYLAGKDEKTA